MASFVDVVAGATALASHVQQIVDALKGTAGKGIPLAVTAVSDPIAYAVAIKNNDAANARGLIVYDDAGATLLQVDTSGVKASRDGTVDPAPVLALANGAAGQVVTMNAGATAAAWATPVTGDFLIAQVFS